MHSSQTRFNVLAAVRGPVTLALMAGLVALTSAAAPALAREGDKAEVFDEAARLVQNNFYDRSLAGKDWDAVIARYRPRYLASAGVQEKSEAINAMLGELKASHMIHATPEDPRYYQLVDIFRFGLRDSIRKHLPSGVSYPGIGIFTREIEGKTFVTGVIAGLAAAKADVAVGDEIVSVDDAPFQPVASFRDKVGSAVKLSLRRVRGGPVSVVEVKPERIEPGKAFRNAMSEGARIIEANGKRIGYIRVWSYAGQDYQDILMEELASGKLKDADALIWDLRDGWGGAQPRYLDLFNARGPDMTFTERSGNTDFASFKWRKPVAMLVNDGTRSGKEVLAYGFKKYGYGEVIGTRTAGALLAGRGYLLSDGSFLMVAVNDVAVDGERLEAKGVAPTIEVPFEVPYAGGADPQLAKAVEVLSEGTKG
ncbi:S41 family peptidase [Hyphomicrobium sp. LHD-15]|uniref:S41 family peptidase n=1 Tax=Hyphomicrobium sp. LHD-15 TaxID=3072142 RepID=UPI00280FB2D1|nr:S41 family peptidase [Hyphomicrobium sp. LHD-15]MDQ8700815.1 S41 family peptidase [Hyphomicrobium sp. LHD-15]